MPQISEQKKAVVKMTCREAGLIFKITDADKPVSSLGGEVMTAIDHYHSCKKCVDIGSSVITGITLSCVESLEMVASDKDGELLYNVPMTLKELVAREHLWGRISREERQKLFNNNSFRRGDYDFFKHACAGACQKFRKHVLFFVNLSPRILWLELGVLRGLHILFLVPLFVEQGWSIRTLFDLHRRQFLSNYCGKGKDDSGNAGYHIEFWQSALLKQIKEGRFDCNEAFQRAKDAYRSRVDEQSNALK